MWRHARDGVDAELHRIHCRFFEDDEWGLDDYVWLYGPYALFIAYEVLILFAAGILH